MKKWFLVSYDVREERRLRKVAKILEGYGSRIQYSVFRCHLTERTLERMRWELVRLLSEEDGFLVVGLCEACLRGVRKRNAVHQWPEDEEKWELL